ncbi:right-handed parallel beta-helix repeat-containing protein [Sphingobacterium spiritivorum]|uniref:right-handed parallel beta-helix repeat-containing protein n=1 Tax=Sphingobacterium spiritivorum TaxID=258 RepID=UPI003DA52136
MKKFTLVLALMLPLFIVTELYANINNGMFDQVSEAIYLKDFGVVANSPKDQTANIQRAFEAASVLRKRLIIGKGTYWINGTEGSDSKQYLYDRGGIKVYSNSDIVFEKGAIFKVLSTSYEAYNGLRIWNVSNVRITGATLEGDRVIHKGLLGEWGHGFFIAGSDNVTISGATVYNFWGDGVNLNCANLDSKLKINNNIVLDRIVSYSNRRQGLSIEAGRNITIRHSEFRNNRGTAPGSGIDIEPWSEEYENVSGIRIENCKFIDNPQGLMVNFPNIRDVNVISCTFTATAKGKVNRHIWQLYGNNELKVSNTYFDNQAINILINSGIKTILTGCNLNNQIKIDAPAPSSVFLTNNKFNGANVSVESRSNGTLDIRKNEFLTDSKVELRGKIKTIIQDNIFSNTKDIFISDYSTGETVVRNNIMLGAKYQAIGTTGNIKIESNISDKSEVFVWIRKNANHVSLIGNKFSTTIGQMLSVEDPASNNHIEILRNIAKDKSILIQDFQSQLFNNKSNKFSN